MGLTRRDFPSTLGGTLGVSMLGARIVVSGALRAEESDPALSGRPLVRYAEKADLILLTLRPPQLETPMKYFDRAIAPNEAFYVRYHIFPIPTRVDLASWRHLAAGEARAGPRQVRVPRVVLQLDADESRRRIA